MREQGGGRAVEQPDDFAMGRIDDLRGIAVGVARTLERALYRRGFARALHQEHHAGRVVHHRRRDRYAMALRRVDLDRDRDTLALMERRTSRKQRLDVNVVAEAHERQVEARKFALADPERRSQLFLVSE